MKSSSQPGLSTYISNASDQQQPKKKSRTYSQGLDEEWRSWNHTARCQFYAFCTRKKSWKCLWLVWCPQIVCNIWVAEPFWVDGERLQTHRRQICRIILIVPFEPIWKVLGILDGNIANIGTRSLQMTRIFSQCKGDPYAAVKILEFKMLMCLIAGSSTKVENVMYNLVFIIRRQNYPTHHCSCFIECQLWSPWEKAVLIL